jgi:hypothetical protein
LGNTARAVCLLHERLPPGGVLLIYTQELRQERNCFVNETVKISGVFVIHVNVKNSDEIIIKVIKNSNK